MDDPTVISQIAHIVVQSEDGSRGKFPLSLADRDEESNLILLCAKHHKVVDDMPHYTCVLWPTILPIGDYTIWLAGSVKWDSAMTSFVGYCDWIQGINCC